jgi:predicted AlkP superfamily pyrophosphatase or phosphodiesterase
MLRPLFTLFTAMVMSMACLAQHSKHVILISIDGLRPEFYLDAKWPTPNLQHLKAGGLYAQRLKSVFPSYTYPSHVAMLTGAMPARSGIYYNAPVGSTGDWNWFMKDIKVPTVWQALKAKGLSTSAIQWPVSVGEGITYNIPEIWDKDHGEDRISETRKYATKGLIEEIEQNATGKLDSVNMNEEFSSMDANAGRMASYIFKTYKPAFMALHFASADSKQHEFGRESEELKLALANIDNSIGGILETIERSGLKDSTTILIVGDHGFMDIHDAVRPNVWLKMNNLLDTKAKFQPSGGSAFLYLKNKNDKQTLDKIKKLLQDLPYSQKKLFNVYDRAKLDEMGADSSAALALAAVPGIFFSGASVDRSGNTLKDALGAAGGGHHGYDPNFPEMATGFIGYGAGINKGIVIPIMGVEDIAPLITTLLGVEFNSPDGILLPSIIK